MKPREVKIYVRTMKTREVTLNKEFIHIDNGHIIIWPGVILHGRRTDRQTDNQTC